MIHEVSVKNIKFGQKRPLVLIAGPCAIESESLCLDTAKRIQDIAAKFSMPYIFKSSYDKANRLSLGSFRGPGLKKGLEVLNKVKQRLNVPVLSDVHTVADIRIAARVLDIIQIPAFLSRQTDMVVEAAKTGKVVNIKKGQFLAPWDILPIIKKAESTGNKKIIVTERGVSFGYNNLVTDFRSLKIMRDFGYPVIYDATHSVQLPGGKGASSGGQRGRMQCRGDALSVWRKGEGGLLLRKGWGGDAAPDCVAVRSKRRTIRVDDLDGCVDG